LHGPEAPAEEDKMNRNTTGRSRKERIRPWRSWADAGGRTARKRKKDECMGDKISYAKGKKKIVQAPHLASVRDFRGLKERGKCATPNNRSDSGKKKKKVPNVTMNASSTQSDGEMGKKGGRELCYV